MAIDTCKERQFRSSSGTSTWTWLRLLSAEPGVWAPTCLQTFFSPSDFKIKKFKKEFKKKKKKKKDFRRKETYFQNADALLQSSGIGQCRPPSAIVVDSVDCSRPFVEVTRRCGHCLAHAGRALRKARAPEGSSTPFHVFLNPTPSTEDVIKKIKI